MPRFRHSLSTANLVSIWPLSAPSKAPLGAGIRRVRHALSMPPDSHAGPVLVPCAGSAEKAPYEVRRRGGETSAHAGVSTALGPSALPSAPLPLNRFYWR
jgi:hypothetical protein